MENFLLRSYHTNFFSSFDLRVRGGRWNRFMVNFWLPGYSFLILATHGHGHVATAMRACIDASMHRCSDACMHAYDLSVCGLGGEGGEQKLTTVTRMEAPRASKCVTVVIL